jgi:hypothetical protein
MQEYIRESALRAQQNKKEWRLYDEVLVIMESPLPKDINIKNVLNYIETHVPRRMLGNVDVVYVGDFDILKKRQIQSLYLNGAVMVTSHQNSEQEMIDMLIHEFAHGLEAQESMFLYGDSVLQVEFLAKRKKLVARLKQHGLECPEQKLLSIVDFSKEIDDYLFNVVGYDRLAMMTTDIFVTPYAATSLREYFANGFEHFFHPEEHIHIKSICPKLYRRIRELTR